jgi:hypothetical protein
MIMAFWLPFRSTETLIERQAFMAADMAGGWYLLAWE